MDNDLPVLAPQTPNPAYPPVPVQDAVKALLGGVGHSIGRMADLPRQAFESSENMRMGGEYNPAPVVDMATSLMGGGMPMAEKGAAGIFGGMLARNADIDALNWAKRATAEGISPGVAYRETGWFHNPVADRWQWEIPDTGARYTGKHPQDFRHGMSAREWENSKLSDVSYPLAEVMKHPMLYDNYPHLANIPVFAQPKGSMGASYLNEIPAIGMGGQKRLSDYLGSMLHEAQHAVQHLEGFPRGTSPNTTLDKLIDSEVKTGALPSNVADAVKSGGIESAPLAYKDQALADYLRTAGESEAYNVSDRLPLWKRGHSYSNIDLPWQTQRFPYNRQIIDPTPRKPLPTSTTNQYVAALLKKMVNQGAK